MKINGIGKIHSALSYRNALHVPGITIPPQKLLNNVTFPLEVKFSIKIMKKSSNESLTHFIDERFFPTFLLSTKEVKNIIIKENIINDNETLKPGEEVRFEVEALDAWKKLTIFIPMA